MTTSPQRPTPAATVLVASTRCWIELSRCLSDLANCLREEALGREVEVLTLFAEKLSTPSASMPLTPP